MLFCYNSYTFQVRVHSALNVNRAQQEDWQHLILSIHHLLQVLQIVIRKQHRMPIIVTVL